MNNEVQIKSTSTFEFNIITGEAWKICDTCGERIETDGKCHDTDGFRSPEKQKEHWEALGREYRRRVDEAFWKAFLGEDDRLIRDDKLRELGDK